jgi:hypothetical protein
LGERDAAGFFGHGWHLDGSGELEEG